MLNFVYSNAVFLLFATFKLVAAAVSPPHLSSPDPLSFVDPRIGTGGDGFGIGSVPIAAQVPFGSMRLGPDTLGLLHSDLEFNHFSGYYYGDRVVRAFSHTRLVGAGVSDYGSVGVMPTRPPVSPASVAQDGTRAAFKKSSETAVPGRYDVSLHSIGVNVSLVAAGPFTALHLYTNTEAAPISLQFDFAHAAGALCCLHSNQHRAASPHSLCPSHKEPPQSRARLFSSER
jgi:putative alpha-1,2-mannosidase